MSHPLADVMVHVDETMNADNRRNLTDEIKALNGVDSIVADETRDHLFIVRYNPAELHAREILARVQTGGLHAELIGL